MNLDFRVREASLKDLPVLVRHRRAMWETLDDFPIRRLDRLDPIYQTWLRKHLAAGEAAAFIAEASPGNPVASGAVFLLGLDPSPRDPKHLNGLTPNIISMFTEKPFRRKGIATRIVRRCVAWSRDHGYRRVTLDADADVASVYRRVGFKRIWWMSKALE
jgi:GNAT superfamily N-acetyltransferase